jgi:hypothetical protein
MLCKSKKKLKDFLMKNENYHKLFATHFFGKKKGKVQNISFFFLTKLAKRTRTDRNRITMIRFAPTSGRTCRSRKYNSIHDRSASRLLSRALDYPANKVVSVRETRTKILINAGRIELVKKKREKDICATIEQLRERGRQDTQGGG